jgi:hypothetical protein
VVTPEVAILAGAFGGAPSPPPSAEPLSRSALTPYAEAIGLAVVVAAITFLSLIVGELVPKRLALNAPELMETGDPQQMGSSTRVRETRTAAATRWAEASSTRRSA